MTQGLAMKLSLSSIARIVGSILLFWALSKHPYGYFTLLRWVVCAIAVYTAYLSTIVNRVPWAWVFGLIALLFNPLIPVRIDRVTWAYLDVAIGIFFLLSIFFVRENLSKKESPNGAKH
jgi:hypothetical protein